MTIIVPFVAETLSLSTVSNDCAKLSVCYLVGLWYPATLLWLPCVPRLLSSLSRPYPRDCYKELLRRIFTFLLRKLLALEGQRGTGLGIIVFWHCSTDRILFEQSAWLISGSYLWFPVHPSPLLWIGCIGVCFGTMHLMSKWLIKIAQTSDSLIYNIALPVLLFAGNPPPVLGRNVRCTWSGEARIPPTALLFHQGDKAKSLIHGGFYSWMACKIQKFH